MAAQGGRPDGPRLRRRTALSNAATSLAQTVYLLALDELFRRETGCLHPKGLAAQEARKRSA
jgi:hypothetical protein